MPRTAASGRVLAAVPLVSRHGPGGLPFTHLICDREFFTAITPGQILWAIQMPGKAFSGLNAFYKHASGRPLHTFGSDTHLLPEDSDIFNQLPEIECYIRGHITGFTSIDDEDSTFSIIDADSEGQNAITAGRRILEAGAAKPGIFETIVSRHKDIDIPARAAVRFG